MKPTPEHTIKTLIACYEKLTNPNHDLIEEAHRVARTLDRRRFDKWLADDTRRQERQRTLFAMLPSCNAVDRLKEKMLQRAYDLLWDGDANGCDALIEFLPSKDVQEMFDAWDHDQSGGKPPSRFYEG
jgi:hypothetical protein